jgi:plasmid stabilization system protein ParE
VTIEFHPEAVVEFESSASYYAKRQIGLDSRFISCIEGALSEIRRNPKRWRVFEDDIRRYLTPVFPYVVLYSVEKEFVLIVAIMHCRREPGYWRYRVKPKN